MNRKPEEIRTSGIQRFSAPPGWKTKPCSAVPHIMGKCFSLKCTCTCHNAIPGLKQEAWQGSKESKE